MILAIRNQRKGTNELTNNSFMTCTFQAQSTLFLSETNCSFVSFGTNKETGEINIS